MRIHFLLARRTVAAGLLAGVSFLLFQAQSPTNANSADGMIPAAQLLNADGTLRFGKDVSGPVNLAGWQVAFDPQRGPVFSPSTPNTNFWQRVGHGVNYTIQGLNRAEVYALAVSGGNIYVGGHFKEVCGDAACTSGNITVNNLAKWDGNTWSAVGNGVNSDVRALAFSGTDLIAGGDFSQTCGNEACDSGNLQVNYLARWNGLTWSRLGFGVNYYVQAFATDGANLYVGGRFDEVCGNLACDTGNIAVNAIARWDGNNWFTLGHGLNNYVYALAISGSDLYVGGYFDFVCGNAACNSGNTRINQIAKWSGGGWSALGGGVFGTVYALAVNGSDLYVGGDFYRLCSTLGCVNGDTVNRIAKWNGAWSALGFGLSDNVYALAFSGGNLYAGGEFTGVCDAGNFQNCGDGEAMNLVNNIARWNGSSWSAIGNGLAAYSYGVLAVAVAGEDIVAGGDFEATCGNASCNTGNTPVNRIARFGPPPTAEAYMISGFVLDGMGGGLGGVTVNLSGTISGSVVTAPNGSYALTDLPVGGNYVVTPTAGGFLFTPPSSSFPNLTGNQVANFTGQPVLLKADYQFQNTLASSVGSAPALTHLGGGVNMFATEDVEISRTVLQFPQANGLSLAPTTGLIPNDSYTIVMLFRFASTGSYRRILDFKNGTSDFGLYSTGGNLNFYNAAIGTGAPIQPNAYVQVVITRAADNVVTGYVNGAQQFSFLDTGGLGVISASNVLRLFQDNSPGGGEESAGAIARLRLYDGPLSPAQVAALDRLPTAPGATSAVSRKVHGGAGAFDINLPLIGTPGVECRSGGGGGNHQVVVTFAEPISVGGVSVMSNNGQAGATQSVNGAQVTVNLSNVADGQTLGITLTNVSNGSAAGDVFIPMSVLLGDTTRNGSVTASDVGQSKALSGQTLGPVNFQADVNANGSINATDIGLVKSRSGNTLP